MTSLVLAGAPSCAAGAARDASATGATGAPTVAARTHAVDLRHVALDLRFDWAARQAIGTATLTLAPRRTTDRIDLDAGRLAIESIVRAAPTDAPGRDVPLAHTYDGSSRDGALRIVLDRPQEANQPLTLRIAYRTTWINHSDPASLGGSNGKGLRFLRPSSTEPTRRRQIWASGEPGSARHWFPSVDAPDVLRTSELRLTLPAPLMAVAGGRLAGVAHHTDGTRTWHWKTESAEPNHRTTFVVGEFVDIPQHHPGVALHNLGYADEAAGVAASVVMHADALHFLSKFIGQPFPHASHTQVFVQDLPWNTPGTALSVQTENMVDDHGTHLDFQYLWDGLQTESLAQQWFGGRIALADWRHAWLERAMAHHLAALYTEQRHGRDEYLLWYLRADQATALGDAALREAVVMERPTDLAAFAMGNATYARGAAVLHMLRVQLGDARWQRVIRHYAAAHTKAGAAAGTEDLRRSVQAVAGRDFGWFFEQWVYRPGHPIFEVAHQWRAGRVEVIVKQVQAGHDGAPPPYYQGPLTIDLGGQVRQAWLKPQAENRYTYASAAEPVYVHVDREGAWLKELRHLKSDAELLRQLRTSTDAVGRQWALQELVSRAKKPDAGGALRAEVLAALRELAGGKHYWRVRFLALQQLASLLTPADAAQPAAIDEATTRFLLRVIREDGSWVRTAALRALGLGRETRHATVYLQHLHDDSDRVVNAAAIALGRSGSPLAYDALLALPAKPSWKNQSLISALDGLRELRDPRGAELALKSIADTTSARWTLTTPVWDFRLAAAETLYALKRGDAAAPLVLERFDKALAEDEVNDMFSNVLLLVTLGDARTSRALAALKQRFAGDANALKVVQDYEERLQAKVAP